MNVWKDTAWKEMASTLNFSATKGDLKIKKYRLEYAMLQMWLNSKWRDASKSLCIQLVFKGQLKVKASPKIFCR